MHCIFAIEISNARYIFSENRGFINTALDQCPSGGVTINDTLMQSAVPNLVHSCTCLAKDSPLVDSAAQEQAFIDQNMDFSISVN